MFSKPGQLPHTPVPVPDETGPPVTIHHIHIHARLVKPECKDPTISEPTGAGGSSRTRGQSTSDGCPGTADLAVEDGFSRRRPLCAFTEPTEGQRTMILCLSISDRGRRTTHGPTKVCQAHDEALQRVKLMTRYFRRHIWSLVFNLPAEGGQLIALLLYIPCRAQCRPPEISAVDQRPVGDTYGGEEGKYSRERIHSYSHRSLASRPLVCTPGWSDTPAVRRPRLNCTRMTPVAGLPPLPCHRERDCQCDIYSYARLQLKFNSAMNGFNLQVHAEIASRTQEPTPFLTHDTLSQQFSYTCGGYDHYYLLL